MTDTPYKTLLAQAKTLGIPNAHRIKKPALIHAIAAARERQEEAPVTAHPPILPAHIAEHGPPGRPDLYGIRAIARYLNRSYPTALKYIQSQGLPAAKIGHEWQSWTHLIDQWRLQQNA